MTSPPSSESALDPWLASARDAVADAAGLAPTELDLDQVAVDSLLDLARIAAHESGDRRRGVMESTPGFDRGLEASTIPTCGEPLI